ncbi:MAG TPA: tetratricopeptide repeat protein [Tepidisphaeraceae bacterium]|jgi:tetratricopeptide (TPR) repeat protein
MTVDEAIQQGLTLHRAGKLNEAEQLYRSILQQARHPAAMHLLGVVLLQRGQYMPARDLIEQAIQLEPNDFAAHNNLSEAYKNLGEFDRALQSAHRALELNPQFGPAHATIADNLMNIGHTKDAGEHAQKAITLAPNDPNAHMVRARYLLATGQLTRGWPEYEWRLQRFPQLRRQLPMPRWTGGKIAGKSILLTAEQGYSDVLQYVRYANLLADRDAEVYVECHPELKRLLSRVRGAVSVIAVREPLPRVDFYVPMPSLPLAFNTTLKTIPSEVPYITAHPKLAEAWADLLKGETATLKVGLAWTGQRPGEPMKVRSCPLEVLSQLGEVQGTTFYTLQEGMESTVWGFSIIDRTNRMTDFADIAGLIANLDLVITVDTAVAHLAGAMGKKVWLMLPYAPEWRWMLAREDTPWYPTAKLFRQETPGDWNGVVKRVKDELGELTRTHV